jgi:hypothetical protein
VTIYYIDVLSDDDAPDVDLTPDVIEARWRLGMAAPDEALAPVAEATITLRNPDGRYAPGSATARLSSGRGLRIRSDDGTSVRTHYLGRVQGVRPTAGEYGPRTATLTATCAMQALAANRVRIEPALNTSAGAVVRAVLDAVPQRPYSLRESFIVGEPDHAALGVNTRLSPSSALPAAALDTGISVFAFIGDRWADGVTALTAIREIVTAERGRFFVDRTGGFVLFDRRETLERRDAVAAFTDDMDDLTLTYGETSASRVTVTLQPRRVGDADEVLWTLGASQLIPAGGRVSFVAGFRGADGDRLGALQVMPPAPIRDYAAREFANGGGADLTGSVDVRLVRADAAAALLEVTNVGSQDAYLLAGAVLRGTALYVGDPITVEAEDPAARTAYGARDVDLNLPLLTSLSEAAHIADYELARRRGPRLLARTLTLRGRGTREQALARTLFDRITVTDTGTGHSADYFIVAEAHTVRGGGAVHETTWTLEPTNPGAFWVVGDGALGEDTRLAY